MNLADPELELIDPTPNVHSLFLQFDTMFFWAKLASRAVVRWSKRMYSCAGICSYEGRGGLCDIALSEPLLKLRPRKDLIETLLHEMIHAYLFVTCRDQDRDGHGPNFKAHMHRINQTAGLNISIYHDFHDEVKLYQTHVWRCNGACQKTRPHFGIVRRTANRAPCERDYWWADHKRRCGGTFVKIKEPGVPANKKVKAKDKLKADITKYVNTNNPQVAKPVLKDSNIFPVNTKSNSGGTLIVPKKGPYIYINPKATKPPLLFSGKGEILPASRPRSNSVGVVDTVRNIWATKNLPSTSPTNLNASSALETVRNIWANKKIPVTPMAASTQNLKQIKALNSEITGKSKPSINKHKIDSHVDSPPAKMKKIDDYFKTTASNILKDLYGQDIKISHTTTKGHNIFTVNEPTLKITPDPRAEDMNSPSSTKHVACPVCSANINSSDINKHLDECLNKEIIENLTKEVPPLRTGTATHSNNLNNYGNIPPIRALRTKTEETDNKINEMIRTQAIMKMPHLDIQEIPKETGDVKVPYKNIEKESSNKNTASIDFDSQNFNSPNSFDAVDVNKVKAIIKKINYDKNVEQSNKYGVPKERISNVDFGYLPSFLDDEAHKIENPIVKIEPGAAINRQKCACCGIKLDKPLEDHLDECLAFFENNNTIPNEGASTSFANETIVIDDDDDIFDESQTFNATGTKTPCPCCLQMIEEAAMNDHLDRCLSGDFQEDL